VDGMTGALADMNTLGVWDPMSVKLQVYKTAIEVCVGTARAHGSQV
jgi:T-complex protein 1 subunit gamma